jgi:hypothetical protein
MGHYGREKEQFLKGGAKLQAMALFKFIFPKII